MLLKADETKDDERAHQASEEAKDLVMEAVTVYRSDLREHPNSVWALVGLRNCYIRLAELAPGQGGSELKLVDKALQSASAHAETVPRGSCCELGLCA